MKGQAKSEETEGWVHSGNMEEQGGWGGAWCWLGSPRDIGKRWGNSRPVPEGAGGLAWWSSVQIAVPTAEPGGIPGEIPPDREQLRGQGPRLGGVSEPVNLTSSLGKGDNGTMTTVSIKASFVEYLSRTRPWFTALHVQTQTLRH